MRRSACVSAEGWLYKLGSISNKILPLQEGILIYIKEGAAEKKGAVEFLDFLTAYKEGCVLDYSSSEISYPLKLPLTNATR